MLPTLLIGFLFALFDTTDVFPAVAPMPVRVVPVGCLLTELGPGEGTHFPVLPLQLKQAWGLHPEIEPSVLKSQEHPAVRAQAASTFFIEAADAGVGSDEASTATSQTRATAARAGAMNIALS
jgi:hypothetical protein